MESEMEIESPSLKKPTHNSNNKSTKHHLISCKLECLNLIEDYDSQEFDLIKDFNPND